MSFAYNGVLYCSSHRDGYFLVLRLDPFNVRGAGKLCLSKHEVYHLDQEMYPNGAQVVQRLPFDPSNEDIFYLHVDGDIIMCNIHTRSVRGSSRSLSARENMSTLMNISINNLPESVLVEILCRLPCANFIFQCKCVCKRWFTLISSRHFVNRFLRLQIDNKMPVVRTLINRNGEEFLNRIQPSSEVIPHMLKRLQSLHGLRKEPVVVATYNDLILCSNTLFDQTEYYICNPYTTQWVALPRPR
ncbi:hypothetical protein DVH24_000291 [Malus domestica]|uniref:F-box domain-containing protein n=1 Tax=Malus domestica TaxID=3750 RepID=A0A498J4B0_MALDO|nr:hypothetical protein DVH24_000291 [Malus domestica]